MRDFIGCSPDTAGKILKQNFISLEEVKKILPFSIKDADKKNFETIPFSAKMIYYLTNNPSAPFILLPGLPYYRDGRLLTLAEMQNFFSKEFPEMIIDVGKIYKRSAHLLNGATLRPRWYLMSAESFSQQSLCDTQIHQFATYQKEKLLAYAYAWTIFQLLRGKQLFFGKPVRCEDVFFHGTGNKTSVSFIDRQMVIKEIVRGQKDQVNLVPSVIPYTDVKNPPPGE